MTPDVIVGLLLLAASIVGTLVWIERDIRRESARARRRQKAITLAFTIAAHEATCPACSVFDQETADGLEQAERYANGEAGAA